MKLQYGVVADYATDALHNKLTVVGVFDTFYRPGEHAKTPLPTFFLVARIEASLVEGTEHSIELRMLDSDGGDIIPRATIAGVQFNTRGPGMPTAANLVAKFDRLEVPGFGTYEFDILVDGLSVGMVPLYIAERITV